MNNLNDYLKSIRRDFNQKTLDENSVHKDPFKQFNLWFAEASDGGVPEFNAMTLSTVSADCKPSSRIVLLRGLSENGFSFFTNYNSRKGKEIERNNSASLLFFWPQMERQIRIEGTLLKLSPEESDDYFKSRPKESRIGAWVSEQSSVISNRKHLEDKYLEIADNFINSEVPRPPYWGGFSLKPNYFEFWQGRQNRLHDRISYSLINSKWKIERLAP